MRGVNMRGCFGKNVVVMISIIDMMERKRRRGKWRGRGNENSKRITVVEISDYQDDGGIILQVKMYTMKYIHYEGIVRRDKNILVQI